MNSYKSVIVGLGAMGMGVAKSSIRAGINTVGCDVRDEALVALTEVGGSASKNLVKAAVNADAVAVVVVNADQSEAVLFGAGGLTEGLSEGSVVLGCATVSADYARSVGTRLEAQGILYLDAPISGGSIKSAKGELSVMASGSPEAFKKAAPLLDAIAGKIFRLGDDIGQGSTMKMINQLLAGVHIASAMEALSLGIRCGLDAEKIFEVITACAGNSWMFENRVPHVLESDYTPRSAIDIFVKDLGIVLEEGKRNQFPLPLSAAAHQQYIGAAGMGLGGEDDAAIIKVYQKMSGITLPGDND
jgi:putative dehydrogenase